MWLRSAREAQGLSLRQIARMAEIDPAQLSRIERGQANPSINSLSRLARVLGLKDLGRLLLRTEENR
jgi:transcriptional regulator with XRE-family HTH domain